MVAPTRCRRSEAPASATLTPPLPLVRPTPIFQHANLGHAFEVAGVNGVSEEASWEKKDRQQASPNAPEAS